MSDISKIINGCNHCIDENSHSYHCYGCAYASEDECVKHLRDDIISALKSLQKDDQPTLPGFRSR